MNKLSKVVLSPTVIVPTLAPVWFSLMVINAFAGRLINVLILSVIFAASDFVYVNAPVVLLVPVVFVVVVVAV